MGVAIQDKVEEGKQASETSSNGISPANREAPPIRDATGRFVPGHPNIGGKKAGAIDGIQTVRKCFGEFGERLCKEGRLLQWMEDKAQQKGGLEWLLTRIFGPIILAGESRGVPEMNVQVNVGIGETRNEPPPGTDGFKQVEGAPVPALPAPDTPDECNGR